MEVTWRLHGDGERHGERHKEKEKANRAADLGEMQAEAVRRGVSAPFQLLAADLPAWGMHVRVSPLDVRFPQLVRVSDPQYVVGMVARAYAASEVARDQVPASRYAVTSIRYRPTRRHVLRYDPLDAPERGTLFAKLYGGDGERAFHVATQVAEWLAEHGDGVTSLRPLAYLPEDGVVLYRQIFGEPLSRHLRRPSQDVARSLKSVGVALHALHNLPQKHVGPLRVQDFAEELRQVRQSSEHLPVLLPSVGAVLKAILERASELHEQLPREQPTFTHGDFISDHVWVTHEGLTFIDFDNRCLADPALDVGKFLADLQLLYLNNGQQGVEQAQEQFLAGYGSGLTPESVIRARLYEVIKLVKMTGRRVFVFEQDWASRTERLIGRAQALMSNFDLTLGLPGRQTSVGGP
jgi:aminoglycoside phosphotransferase (APT) family kinase protein